MPRSSYIDASGNLVSSPPIWQRLLRFLSAIWRALAIFFATLFSPQANQTARQGGYKLQGGPSGGGGGGDRRGSANDDLRQRRVGTLGGGAGSGTQRGLYGEAPCCGR
ncbi:unnamed protein product [Jaminaea pallidilutea]